MSVGRSPMTIEVSTIVRLYKGIELTCPSNATATSKHLPVQQKTSAHIVNSPVVEPPPLLGWFEIMGTHSYCMHHNLGPGYGGPEHPVHPYS